MTQDLAGQREAGAATSAAGELHPPEKCSRVPLHPTRSPPSADLPPHGDLLGVPCVVVSWSSPDSDIQESRLFIPIQHYQGSLHTLQGRGLKLEPISDLGGRAVREHGTPLLGTGPHSPPDAHDCKQPESQAALSG